MNAVASAVDATQLQQALAVAMMRGMSVALWARLMPDAPAILSEHGSRSFAELNARCNQLVRALRACDVQAGDGIALLCSNRVEFAEVFWASRRAGLRITPVNWHLTADEAAYIVNDCDAKALFFDARFAGIAQELAEKTGCARFAIGGPVPGFDDYEQALAGHATEDVTDPQLGTSMLYTSGTTGRPKGVLRAATAGSPTGDAAAYTPGESVHLCTGPLYHAAPLSFSLAVPNMFGAAVVMMDGWDAERALALIERHRVTHTHMVPTMFHRMLALPEAVRTRHDLRPLRYVLHGAAPCPVTVKRRLIEWLGPIVHEYYAATEGMGCMVDSPTWLAKPGTVGQPEPGHVRILGEDGREMPAGEVGTVYLRAPDEGRFSYYKDPTKTAKAYAGSHYTLGDMGYLDDDGFLFLTDRSAHLIISGGVNIYPAEVEAVLLTHPAVADAGVIGVPNEEWGEEVKAVVMLHRQHPSSPELAQALIAHCRSQLAHFKCPKSVDFVDELPRLDNGKLYKQKLREAYRSRA
ncbi:AMP-binding protein [Rhizobacter sp. J219]|uniref:AMP-binding protein n=1 Tax=Rhizobacter sp. J219 TaxID=2898430 RepID=UPI002150A5C8|nr:AMP-binding protein [Rhizobacter sp. J219]MCR5883897.1 AMP-binding protein [Rhizobacter sp. J219]